MTTPATIQKLTAWASDSSARIRGMGEPVWRILNLSLGDDAISWKRTLGISIEKGGVSIVEATRFLSRIRIRNVRRYPFDDGKVATPENVAGIVSLAVRDLKARNVEICLGIPKAWAIIQHAELPASAKETLPDVVSYELDRLTPFTPDEAFYDYRVLRENPDKLHIVVTAAKTDLIRPYVQALPEKKVRLDRVQVNLSGMAALLGYAGQEDDFVFLELDDDGYEGALIQNGSLSSVLSGRLDGSDDEMIIKRAVDGILPFIEQLKREGKSPRLFTHLKGRFRDRGYALLERHVTVPYQVLNDLDLKLDFPGRREGIPYAALGVALESLWPACGADESPRERTSSRTEEGRRRYCGSGAARAVCRHFLHGFAHRDRRQASGGDRPSDIPEKRRSGEGRGHPEGDGCPEQGNRLRQQHQNREADGHRHHEGTDDRPPEERMACEGQDHGHKRRY